MTWVLGLRWTFGLPIFEETPDRAPRDWVRRVVHHSKIRPLMSALGHVWTAPWQELSDVAAALVGCGHVSGLFVRR